jgi:hypothetical protein
MLGLLQALPRERYWPLTYVAAESDTTSEARAKAAKVRALLGGRQHCEPLASHAFGSHSHPSASTPRPVQPARPPLPQVIPADAPILRIPRSREVGQSYVTALWSTARALAATARLVAAVRPDVVLVNGPGTCLPVCIAAVGLSLLGVAEPRVVFVESVCRVGSLSLTGRLLYALRLADQVQVQWRSLHDK